MALELANHPNRMTQGTARITLANCLASSSRRACENAVECSCVGSRIGINSSSCRKSVCLISKSAHSSSENLDTPRAKRICCLKQRFAAIFNCEHSSDVLFIVGQGEQEQRIRAHKLILSAGSPVFHTMFNKNWASGFPEVEVPDIEPPAFTTMLRFLYTDEVALSPDTADKVLYAARKYAVDPLENLCVDFLSENLCPTNVFKVLKQATQLDNQHLIKLCLEAVDKDTAAAIDTDAFCDVEIDTLCLILSRNTLTSSEIELFKALLRWSKTQCLKKKLFVCPKNQQLVLARALPLVRFPLMRVKEFSSAVAQSGLLTDKEIISLYPYFTSKLRPPIIFNVVPRLENKELVVNRFEVCGVDEKIGLNTGKTWDAIHFTCDCGLELLGYGMYGSVTGSARYEVTLSLEDAATGDMLRKESDFYTSDSVTMTYRALFKNPIRITPHRKYTASVFVKGPDCFTGSEGSDKITSDLLDGQKGTFSFESLVDTNPCPRTTVRKGLIPQLIFKV